MKKFAILILSILIAGLFVACNQDITVDAQTYANMEVGTFVLNGQNYATLQEAVNAKLGKSAKALGENDGVIYLTRNASGPGAVIDVSGTPVIIDFAGYTYSFTNVTGLQGGDNPKAETFGLGITNGADVTLKGLEQIDLNDTSTVDLTMVYVAGSNTKLTIEDAPKMKVEDSQYVFWAADGATLTIGSTTTTSEKTEITGKIAATGTNESKPVVSFNNDTKINASELKVDAAIIIVNTSEESTVGSVVLDDAVVIVSGEGSVKVEENNSSATASYEIQNASSNVETKIIVGPEGPEQETIAQGEAVEIDEGQPVPDPKIYVASIGTRLYEKLAEAITYAESGETILLLSDYDMETNEPGYGWSTNYNNVNTSLRNNCIDFIKNDVTFDLNNHKITNLFNNTFRIQADNITIRNGELRVGSLYLYMYSGGTWSSIPEGEGRICSYILYADAGTNLVIDELTTYGGINIASGGLATINNLSFSGTKFYAVCSQSESTVVLNDGMYDKVTGVTTNYLFWIDTGSGMIINNGTFLSRDGSINNFASGVSPVIYGGKFNFDPSTYVAEGYEAVKDGDYWIVKEAEPVAENINTETKYFSLQKAIDEAGDGHTIKILKDIDYGTASYTAANAPVKITKSLNLDGNSHKIKAVSIATGASRFVYITNLYNTSDTPASDTADSTHITVNISNLTLDLDGSNGYAICYEGNVSGTVENCTITHPSNGICVKGSHAGSSPYNYIRADKTILNVKDCTVTSLNRRTDDAIYNAPLDVELGATMTVEGGSYSGEFSATTMSSGGTIILKSGNLTNAINVNNNEGYADKYIWIPGEGYKEHSAAQSTVRIEGGNYTNFSGTAVGGTGATLSITGGTFDHDPSAYVAEGYVVVQTGTNEWTVQKESEEVTVVTATKTETMSLARFRNNWNDGDYSSGFVSATLIDDVDISSNPWQSIGTWANPFYGVFDGNGKTIKGLNVDNDNTSGEIFETDTVKSTGVVYGFIGLVGNGDVTVTNLTLTDVDINIPNIGNCVGAIIGYASSTSDYSSSSKGGQYGGSGNTASANVTITDCMVKGADGKTISVKDCAGGIMGKAYNTGALVIQGCTTEIEVRANNGRAAGICGYVSGPNSANVTSNTVKSDVYATDIIVDKIAAFTNIGKAYVYDNNTTIGMKAYFKVNDEFVEQTDCYSLTYTYENNVAQTVEFSNDLSKVKYGDHANARVSIFKDGTIINDVTVSKKAFELYGDIIINNLNYYGVEEFKVYGNTTLNNGVFGHESDTALLTVYKGGVLIINDGSFDDNTKICNNGTVYLNHMSNFSGSITNYHIQGDNTGTYYMNCPGNFYTYFYLNGEKDTTERTFTDDSGRYTYTIGVGLNFVITDDSETVGTYRHLNITSSL